MVLPGRVLCAGLLGVMSAFAGAETRWCTARVDMGRDPLHYPPIARAAHVSGVVIGRMMFRPTGEVVGLEKMSGPEMLFVSTREQMERWTVTTEATGGELCQTLACIDYKTQGEDDTHQQTAPVPTGMIRLTVETQFMILSDPAADIVTHRWRWFRFTRRVR